MRLALAAAVVMLATGSAWAEVKRPPILESGLDAGWWVVVGSGPEPSARGPSIASTVNAAAARCGFSTFNDFSAKFSGFRPGYEVFVIGAFKSKEEASLRLEAVKPCIPSAYLKAGSYAGE